MSVRQYRVATIYKWLWWGLRVTTPVPTLAAAQREPHWPHFVVAVVEIIVEMTVETG